MGKFRRSEPPRRQPGAGLLRGVAWMMNRSLVVYVAAVSAQRVWTVLNADLGQMIRRT